MAESVPVRCPECRREHTYTPPVYPCACGAPVSLPLLRGGLPVQVRHRTWRGSWVEVRCPACGTAKEWPQPELGCACGTTLRLLVASPRLQEGYGDESGGGYERGYANGQADEGGYGIGNADGDPGGDAGGEGGGDGSGGTKAKPMGSPSDGTGKGKGAEGGRPHVVSCTPRPAFSPITIRTAQDARAAAAQYLLWLGFDDVRVTEKSPASGVDVRGPLVVAHVDPTTAPTAAREIETLWLNALNDSAAAVCFSLAGYTRESRARADALSVSLFVLDLTGMPQPVNDQADELIRATA